jgi:tetratricopeptide (TPR) repeat protein
VATSLEDRHDAALAQGLLDDALEYVSIAESLFKSDNVPPGVLFRIASTSRQIADNVIARAIEAITDHPKRIEHIEPEIRHRAAEQYERAGDYFLRHARALTAVPDADDDWARSLWLAADSFDLAGRRRKAIRHFLEYIESRSIDDPRRAEATFRLAQAYHAEHDFASAATNYERVIEEHPRSPYGTRSHVPLARCYVALDRRPEAEQQLRRVLDGSYDAINPDAIDYRDALIELGVIQYESAQFVPAIERLTEAVTRYPDDERINEIRFRLADSYRRHALATREQLSTEPNLSPQQHRLLELRIDDEFESALIGFDRVCDGYLRLDPRRLNRLQRDFERNAWMYRADAAFELGRYELAVDLYDKAARRYAEHAASMHALVQIINCYELTGDARRAEVAHRNAVKRLAQLPDDVLDDPENLMDREAWERWLRRRPADRLVRTDPHEAPN